MKHKIQIGKEHYYEKYDDTKRFLAYLDQIKLVKKQNPTNVLEIGIGNKTVSNYLKQSGLKVTTCDFDKELGPDYVADIRKLPFKENSFDVVLAAEILEHLPWEDLETALKELARVSKDKVIVSIPYSAAVFEVVIKFPFIKSLLNRDEINFYLRVPYFFHKHKFKGQHYWEMGRKGYPRSRVRKAFSEYFTIKQEIKPLLNNYHYIFLLEKKGLEDDY
jgi:ubiquinone/menaquinone biosynthesis C-methylase UbiE